MVQCYKLEKLWVLLSFLAETVTGMRDAYAFAVYNDRVETAWLSGPHACFIFIFTLTLQAR